jgi:hypothetical protein
MHKLAALLVVGVLASMGPGLHAQKQSVTNLGTLTCTSAGTRADVETDATLSCNFRGQSGLEGDFTARIVRAGRHDVPSGKRVLVWSVLSTKPKVELGALEGEYRGTTGGQRPHLLIGGADRSIQLQPLTTTSQAGEFPAPSLLELRIKPTKA